MVISSVKLGVLEGSRERGGKKPEGKDRQKCVALDRGLQNLVFACRPFCCYGEIQAQCLNRILVRRRRPNSAGARLKAQSPFHYRWDQQENPRGFETAIQPISRLPPRATKTKRTSKNRPISMSSHVHSAFQLTTQPANSENPFVFN